MKQLCLANQFFIAYFFDDFDKNESKNRVNYDSQTTGPKE